MVSTVEFLIRRRNDVGLVVLGMSLGTVGALFKEQGGYCLWLGGALVATVGAARLWGAGQAMKADEIIQALERVSGARQVAYDSQANTPSIRERPPTHGS